MTAVIYLRDGETCLVDEQDYEEINEYKWIANHVSLEGTRKNYYAHGLKAEAGCISMHRWLMKPPPEMIIDHKDGNGWNNQRSNLRICDYSQNGANMIREFKWGYRGVWKNGNGWGARITIRGKRIQLGTFEHKLDAAMAWDRAAIEGWGEFARTNLPREGYD